MKEHVWIIVAERGYALGNTRRDVSTKCLQQAACPECTSKERTLPDRAEQDRCYLRVFPALVMDTVAEGSGRMVTLNLQDLRFVEQFAVETEDFFILVKLLLWYHAVARHEGTAPKLLGVGFD